jgi:hypothetical protein
MERAAMLAAHMAPPHAQSPEDGLMAQHTAAEQQQGVGEAAADEGHQYAVVLPDSLTSNRWIVRRNSQSPRRLVDTFPPPHDDIHTLYDVLESSVAQFGDVSGACCCPAGVTQLGRHCKLCAAKQWCQARPACWLQPS